MSVTEQLENGLHDGRGLSWPPAKTIYALRHMHHAGKRRFRYAHEDPRDRASGAGTEGILVEDPRRTPRAANIVSAQRGYYGGYRLTRAPADIRVDELLNAVGTRDPFPLYPAGEEMPLPFIDDLCGRLHALAVEALHAASLAELVSGPAPAKYDLTGQDSKIC